MSAAVGVSVDNHGIGDGRNVLVPSFAAQGGIGEGLLGFEARLFASEAAGRFSSPNPTPGGKPVADVGADRQAVDVMLAVRPLCGWGAPEDHDWTARFVRALALELGLAVERVSVGTVAVFRTGLVTGAHLDLPLARTLDGSELRLTVAARRMVAGRQTITIGSAPSSVGDSRLEAFSGLAVSF